MVVADLLPNLVIVEPEAQASSSHYVECNNIRINPCFNRAIGIIVFGHLLSTEFNRRRGGARYRYIGTELRHNFLARRFLDVAHLSGPFGFEAGYRKIGSTRFRFGCNIFQCRQLIGIGNSIGVVRWASQSILQAEDSVADRSNLRTVSNGLLVICGDRRAEYQREYAAKQIVLVRQYGHNFSVFSVRASYYAATGGKMKKTTRTMIAIIACLPWICWASESQRPLRPVHTYSIVARDAETGELGAAVQSHWFSVGSSVIWAEPGVGAVATQSFTDPSYGPLGLQLMRAGKSADQALTALLAADAHEDVRQVGMVDANGTVSNHTGDNAIVEFCNLTGDGFAVQANLMWKPTVCSAMFEAFENAEGDIAERMLVTLEAAEGEGGDIRGKQSVALLVVSGDISQPAWGGRIFDLRIEDHTEPLTEMRRLLTMARAYRLMNEGDDHMTSGEVEKAIAAYSGAEALVPDSHEMIFWHAATLAAAGRVDESLPLFKKAFDMRPLWRELVQRLPASGLLPDDPELMERILSVE